MAEVSYLQHLQGSPKNPFTPLSKEIFSNKIKNEEKSDEKGLDGMISIRKATISALLFFLASVLCATTAWADVTDRCDGLDGPGSYQNLAPSDLDYIRWSNPPDSSYLCQQSNRRTASAVYRCTDAVEVTVALYSRYGCYAGYDGGELVRGGEGLPLLYQPSTGEVYCDGRRMAYDAEEREFVFLEPEGRPSGLTEYGLSVYCSRDGEEYVQVSTQLITAWREAPDTYWYEVYQADLTEGTRYLKLVLTDQSSIEILGREERYQFETVGGLSLALVEIVEEEGASSWSANREWEWYDDEGWDNWEEDISGTGGLPSYQAGEEEGSGTLLWGPEEPTDGGPAFPDETEDEDGQEAEESPEESSSSGGSSSSKSQPQRKAAAGGQTDAADGDPPEAVQESTKTVQVPAATRREVPLWRRVTEPDAVTMIIISITLMVMGVRVLLENSGRKQERSREKQTLAEQEAMYARYSAYEREDDER